jgi:acetoin utilization deacetylase AcuC-like enzyme
LGGGFHHAHAEKAAGYCLVNDVAIAIEKFRRRHAFRRPMIVDLDYHEGDGNLVFFQNDENVYTFSMHASDWVEIEKENNTDIMLPTHCDGQLYLKILREQLTLACNKFKPDIIFYIAGSDPYEKDLIGDLNLTRAELLERNVFVYEKVKSRGIPMVVVAGGGYGLDSWQIYYDFIEYVLVNI